MLTEEFIQENKLPAYRVRQFNEAFYEKAVTSYDRITSWPKDLRAKLEEQFPFTSLEEMKTLLSKDNMTVKAVFRLKRNKKLIETVLMRHTDGRNTVCVSCMVGCPVKCSFCATGKMGYGGDLEAREIVDQVLFFKRFLVPKGENVTNIVFMGMGEPTLTLDNVLAAVEVFTSPEKLAMSQRRITLSTSGHLPEMQRLLDLKFKGRIAVSLHAPNQDLRAKLMPVAYIHKLTDLMDMLDQFVMLNNKRISYEYILLKEVNDTIEHAEQLARLLKNRLAHINLIPYNPVPGESFERPSRNRVHKFAQILRDNGIRHTIRITMGDDIAAACGQLATDITQQQVV